MSGIERFHYTYTNPIVRHYKGMDNPLKRGYIKGYKSINHGFSDDKLYRIPLLLLLVLIDDLGGGWP